MGQKRDKWMTPTRGEFSFVEMIDAINKYIAEDTDREYKIIVGGDSQAINNIKTTRYITTVIVRRVGKGGQYYFYTDYQPLPKSLRQKIWNEVMSIYETIVDLKDAGLSREIIDIIPHVDVGVNGDTRHLIKEVTGLFLSEGYDVEIKPDSFASSTVADKHSK